MKPKNKDCKMKKLIVLVLAAVTASVSLMAEDTFRIQVGGDILADQSTEMSYGTDAVSAGLNIEDFFGMDTDNQVFRLDGYYRFNESHRIEFAYYKIDSSGSLNVNRDFTWDGRDIASGAQVDSHFNVDMYKVNYTYSFYHSDKVELGLGAGLHITGIDVGLNAQGNIDGVNGEVYKGSVKVTAPLPVVGVRLRYDITKDLEANFSYDLFMIKVGDYKGEIQNTIFTLDYAVTESFGVGAGMDLYSLTFESDKDDQRFKATRTVNGALVYLSYRY
jgi:hypothetical protein